jgi:LPS O-antigen subunit length determinant protein (WzzB/FepE family)
MRLSRIVRQPETPTHSDAVPLRRVILWIVVGAVLVVGLVLYFKFERLLPPLVG